VRDTDDAVQPCGEDGNAGGGVVVEGFDDVDRIRQHGAGGEASQEECDDVGTSAGSGEGVDDEHRNDGAKEGEEGRRAEAEEGVLREEEDADTSSDDCAAGGADDVGIGHGVAKETLKHEAGDGERAADDGGAEHAWQADREEDGVLRRRERLRMEECEEEGADRDPYSAKGGADEDFDEERSKKNEDNGREVLSFCGDRGGYGREDTIYPPPLRDGG